jgi:hypothetical protein
MDELRSEYKDILLLATYFSATNSIADRYQTSSMGYAIVIIVFWHNTTLLLISLYYIHMTRAELHLQYKVNHEFV